MPSIEAFRDRKKFPKVHFVLYDYFFKPAMLNDDLWRQRCRQHSTDFGPTPTEAQVHTFLEDQYFAWIYESQCLCADIPQFEGKKLWTDYDYEVFGNKLEVPKEYLSVCDIVLPDLEVEYDEIAKDFVVIKREVDVFAKKTKYVRVSLDTVNHTQGEEDSTQEAFLAMRQRRLDAQRKLAKETVENNQSRKDLRENVETKLGDAETREDAYEQRREKAVGKKQMEEVEKKICIEETAAKRRDMDRLKTLSGVVEKVVVDGKVGEKRRKVIKGFTERTAAFFSKTANNLKKEKKDPEVPRKKWENAYRLLWSLKGQDIIRRTPKRESRKTSIDALNLIEL